MQKSSFVIIPFTWKFLLSGYITITARFDSMFRCGGNLSWQGKTRRKETQALLRGAQHPIEEWPGTQAGATCVTRARGEEGQPLTQLKGQRRPSKRWPVGRRQRARPGGGWARQREQHEQVADARDTAQVPDGLQEKVRDLRHHPTGLGGSLQGFKPGSNMVISVF